MPISPARRIAFEVLRRVEAECAFASDLLHARLAERVKRADTRLTTELVFGVLRQRRLLDFLISRALQKPTTKLDPEVLISLRLAVYQLRFLERVPPSAAVNESVELVKRTGKRSAAPLVNAVLRRIVTDARGPAESYLPPDMQPAERLGILYSHPTWLVERWLPRFGQARTVALLEANNRAPRLACVVNQTAQRVEILRSLATRGLRIASGGLLRDALVVSGGDPSQTEAFARGWISIQDEASQLVAMLAGVERGHSVLDLCAAPGGKTAILARAAGPDALVVAADIHPHRLRALRANLERTRIGNVKMVALDAAKPLPFSAPFERVLVDAPCSGTGTLAGNPEIRWRLQPEDLREFHERQAGLLTAALNVLAPGGHLVYSTCSLEQEENESVIEQVTHGRRDLQMISRQELAGQIAPCVAKGLLAEELFDDQGFFRTFPGEIPTAGFFAAVLLKGAR